MKRFVILLAALALLSRPSFASVPSAEEPSLPANELSVSYGVISVPYLANVFGGILGSAFTFGLAQVDEISSLGSFGVEYKHFVLPYLAVGGCLSVEPTTLSFKANGDSEPSEPQRNTYFTVMPSVKATWFRRNCVSMYSNLYAGIWLSTPTAADESTTVGFSFQLSPICIDLGGKHFRGFAELGFGMRGLATCGLRWMF